MVGAWYNILCVLYIYLALSIMLSCCVFSQQEGEGEIEVTDICNKHIAK